MVDERAMSTITWINSPKRNRQKVSTVSDHLAIRDYDTWHEPVSINYLIYIRIDSHLD